MRYVTLNNGVEMPALGFGVFQVPEWLATAGIATIVYVNGYVRAMRSGQSAVGLGTGRLAAGTTCYVAELAGAVLLILGYVAGI